MITVNEVEVMENEIWRNNPPQYNNLMDKRTVEWAMAKEFASISNELENLKNLTEKVDRRFVNGLQQGSIKDWDAVIAIIEEWKESMEQGLALISERFY